MTKLLYIPDSTYISFINAETHKETYIFEKTIIYSYYGNISVFISKFCLCSGFQDDPFYERNKLPFGNITKEMFEIIND